MSTITIDRAVVEQALEALQNCANGEDDVLLTRDALANLRAALAEPEGGGNLPPPLQERNFCPRCGKRNSGVHTCTPPSTEPQCNPHPKAPHGFLRNASHTEDRYVCECEHWEPYEAGYQAGMEAALRAQL